MKAENIKDIKQFLIMANDLNRMAKLCQRLGQKHISDKDEIYAAGEAAAFHAMTLSLLASQLVAIEDKSKPTIN